MEIGMVAGLMIKDINLTFEIGLGASAIYFVLLCFWRPYHKVAEKHNKILILNRATLLLFLITCYLF